MIQNDWNSLPDDTFDDEFADLFDDDIDFDDVMESRGEIICDNCLSGTSGHCPGQLDCEKYHCWMGTSVKSPDISDFEPRTIGFHLLDPENN